MLAKYMAMSFPTFLEKEPIARDMLRCLDTIAEVGAFAKTHRPEEQTRLTTARSQLERLKAEFPNRWAALSRYLRGAS